MFYKSYYAKATITELGKVLYVEYIPNWLGILFGYWPYSIRFVRKKDGWWHKMPEDYRVGTLIGLWLDISFEEAWRKNEK